MTIFIHYVLNTVAYVLLTSELPRLRSLQKRKYSICKPTQYIVVGQPLKSSVTWIIPKGGYLNSQILNCTIIVSTVKYRGYWILST